MIKIDFEKTKPDFVNGEFRWYIDKHFQDYIENKQAENLPKLKGFGCFIVKGNDVEDYVLRLDYTREKRLLLWFGKHKRRYIVIF